MSLQMRYCILKKYLRNRKIASRSFCIKNIAYGSNLGKDSKNCVPCICMLSLTSIFNQSIRTRIFPTDWKFAGVTPIHKSGERCSMSNYRPIPVISILACKNYGAKYLWCKRNSIAIAGERCSISNYRSIPVISIVACKNYGAKYLWCKRNSIAIA